MKELICLIVGVCGSAVATLFGGWSDGMTILLIFMAVDYISGIMVAGVFKKSTKTDSGALESRSGFKGLLRKAMMIAIVIVFNGIDVLTPGNLHIARDGAVIALCCNELISLIENAGLMGIKLPKFITNTIDVFIKKNDK